MSSEVVTVPPSSPLAHAINLMLERGIRRLVVVDEEGRPIGMLTVRDIARALSRRGAPWRWRSPEKASVSRFMSREVVSIGPKATVGEAASLMLERGISGLPVVSRGRVVGIITKTDVVRFYSEEMKGRFRVRELMSRDLVWVREGDSLKKVARVMKEKSVGRVLVLNGRGAVIGIVTERDLAYAGLSPLRRVVVVDMESGRSAKEVRAKTAGEIMSSPVVMVGPEVDAAKAARMMLEWGFSGLPVSEDGERAVGILTKTDIVRGVSLAGEER
ncbi:MAG: inosine-5-monophosphate dehydrogenase [Thermoproteota archaeon]|nr:MAG: inosine-5-monophosphate dehydrogenase [Candidatus Korarchaeota archaeon]